LNRKTQLALIGSIIIVVFLFFSSLFFSCESIIKNDKTYNHIDATKSLAKLAPAFNEVIKENPGFISIIKEEANKKFDGTTDVLFDTIKNRSLTKGGKTFAELLSSKLVTKGENQSLEELISQIPYFNIYVFTPKVKSLTKENDENIIVVANRYDVDDMSDEYIVYGYDGLGNEYQFTRGQEPDKTTFVLGVNESLAYDAYLKWLSENGYTQQQSSPNILTTTKGGWDQKTTHDYYIEELYYFHSYEVWLQGPPEMYCILVYAKYGSSSGRRIELKDINEGGLLLANLIYLIKLRIIMKNKINKNLFLILFILFMFFVLSKYSFAQQTIYIQFDWLADFCEKNSIQISYYGIFAPGGLDAFIGLGQLTSSTFNGQPWYLTNYYYISAVYSYVNFPDEKLLIGYRYTIELDDFNISKKIPLNKFFTYYPGICFYLRFTSDIIVDNEKYYWSYSKPPHEINIKIGTSQSIEYQIKNFIIKFSTNIFYTYYDYYRKDLFAYGEKVVDEYMVKGHYLVFQFFLLSGFVLRKNIKIFFGLESMLSTNYIYKNIYI
jgi:hypothetical protein